jgi:D-sedoheptulose 7-phosphate isomerase
MIDYAFSYIQDHRAVLDSIPVGQVAQLIQKFREAQQEDRRIFVVGNGGSGANASHFVTDLGKSASDKMTKPFRCLSLNDNVSWITALGNDYAYEDVFVRQLMNFAKPGDLFLGLSVSGNSPNMVKAMAWANQNGLYTMALVGGKKGSLAEQAKFSIVIDSEHYGKVEDAHMAICHIVCYAFIENKSLQK